LDIESVYRRPPINEKRSLIGNTAWPNMAQAFVLADAYSRPGSGFDEDEKAN